MENMVNPCMWTNSISPHTTQVVGDFWMVELEVKEPRGMFHLRCCPTSTYRVKTTLTHWPHTSSFCKTMMGFWGFTLIPFHRPPPKSPQPKCILLNTVYPRLTLQPHHFNLTLSLTASLTLSPTIPKHKTFFSHYPPSLLVKIITW